jgi:opacity protein-like surface antigen
LLFLLLINPARADEQIFNYTYGAEVMPEGTSQIYQWVTQRSEKAEGSYQATDYRTEYEYGLTNRLQLSLYLDARSHFIEGSAPVEDDGMGGSMDAYPDLNRKLGFDGVAAAFKYNILSPYIGNGLGIAVYLEPGYSRIFKITGERMEQYSLEAKLIIQKNFLDDRLVTAINFTPEFEKRRFDNDPSRSWGDEMAFEVTAGASYLVAPKWYVGLETRYHSEYPSKMENDKFGENPKYGTREHYAVFLGPTIHYATTKWWVTATWLPQLFGGMPDMKSGPFKKHLNEHEKNEFRLKIAYNF